MSFNASGLGGALNAALLAWLFPDQVAEFRISKKCPFCGQLYMYNYYYEFSVGYVEERVWVERMRAGLGTGC